MITSIAIGLALMVGYECAIDILGRWRVSRENATRAAEYEAARASARRNGTKPPFPPNLAVWR